MKLNELQELLDQPTPMWLRIILIFAAVSCAAYIVDAWLINLIGFVIGALAAFGYWYFYRKARGAK